MWSFIEVVIELVIQFAEEWCSWRILLCLVIALGIVGGLYYKYPKQDGHWSVSVPAALVVIGLGIWWEIRSDGT